MQTSLKFCFKAFLYLWCRQAVKCQETCKYTSLSLFLSREIHHSWEKNTRQLQELKHEIQSSAFSDVRCWQDGRPTVTGSDSLSELSIDQLPKTTAVPNNTCNCSNDNNNNNCWLVVGRLVVVPLVDWQAGCWLLFCCWLFGWLLVVWLIVCWLVGCGFPIDPILEEVWILSSRLIAIWHLWAFPMEWALFAIFPPSLATIQIQYKYNTNTGSMIHK